MKTQDYTAVTTTARVFSARLSSLIAKSLILGVVGLLGCSDGSVDKVVKDQTTVEISVVDFQPSMNERTVQFFDLQFTPRESLSAGSYEIHWEVTDGAELLPGKSWKSARVFGGVVSERSACYGVADTNTPDIVKTPALEEGEPFQTQIAFVAPPVDEDRTIEVSLFVTGDEGVAEEQLISAEQVLTITIKALPDLAALTLSDAALQSCAEAAINACGSGLAADITPLYEDTGLFNLSCETPVASLTELQQLPELQSLTLTLAGADSLSPFSALTSLNKLALSGTMATNDLTPLDGLANLDELALDLDLVGVADGTDLALTQITNLIASVHTLDICSEEVGSIAELRNAGKVRTLRVCDYNLSDPEVLSELTELRELEYRRYRPSGSVDDKLVDYTLFTPLTLLTSLTATGDEQPGSLGTGADIRPLSSLTNLKHLDLSFSQVADLEPLRTLTEIETLDISHNFISDIEPLKGIDKLKSLDVSSNQIVTIPDISEELINLGTIDIASNRLTDDGAAAIDEFDRLATLNVRDNALTKDAFLGVSTRVKTLDISCNALTSVSRIAGTSSITELTIDKDVIESGVVGSDKDKFEERYSEDEGATQQVIYNTSCL